MKQSIPYSRTVVHYSRRHVLPRDALSPGSLDVQIQLRFTAVLPDILQIPLILEKGIRRILARRICGILNFVQRHEVVYA